MNSITPSHRHSGEEYNILRENFHRKPAGRIKKNKIESQPTGGFYPLECK